MTLSELAIEYRESGALLKRRITDLRAVLEAGDTMSETEKRFLRARIDTLASMYRDVSETAVNLERYYDRRYRRSARFTV